MFVFAALTVGVITGSLAPRNSVALLLPEFAIHKLPAPSTATAVGVFIPPPVNPVEGDSGLPLLLNSDTLLFPFTTHMYPVPPTATATGELNPPPVNVPLDAPVLLTSTRLLPPLFADHTSPEASIAIPELPPL